MSGVSIFVDESGDSCPTQRLFSVGAVWCSPRSLSNQHTLGFTHKALMAKALALTGNHNRKELSHSEGLALHDDDLFYEMSLKVPVDASVNQKDKPWTGFPLKFTTSIAHPTLETRMSSSREAGNQIRARCLMQVLHPLTVYRGNAKIEAEVVLDDVVWAKAVAYCGDDFESPRIAKNLSFHFTYEKSLRIPGLQVADLVAGMNRHYCLTAENQSAHAFVDQNTLRHLEVKALFVEETF